MSETTDNIHPYSLEVQPIPGREGEWQWIIRRYGKLYQRSDRKHPSEAKAREQGMETIQKLLSGNDRAF